MKSYFWKFFICIVPVLLACWITWDASQHGRFKLGVDLSGGTILVYEMDLRKLEEKLKEKGNEAETESLTSYYKSKASELADALKRRIDPTATYNIVIRPAGSEGRVEIILPTGGTGKLQEAEDRWKKLLVKMEDLWFPDQSTPAIEKDDTERLLQVPRGSIEELIDQIRIKKSRITWDKELLNNREAWNRLIDKLQFNEKTEKGYKFLENPVPASVVSLVGHAVPVEALGTVQLAAATASTGLSYLDRLNAVAVGDIDGFIDELTVAFKNKTPQQLESDLRQWAWEELLYQITEWKELRKAVAANIKVKDEKKKEKLVEERLRQLKEDLKTIPPDSFHELVGRIETAGNVVSQAGLDALAPLLGRIDDIGVMERKKIEEFINDHYGPSPKIIRDSMEDELNEEEIGQLKDPSLEDVQRIKDLVSKVGALEFRILANEEDDKVAIQDTIKLLNTQDAAMQERLETAAVNGEPPPAPFERIGNQEKLKVYTIDLPNNNKSKVTYSWVELGKQERRMLGFNNDARIETSKSKRDIWNFMAAHNNEAVQVVDPSSPTKKKLWQGALFFRRECKNRNLPESERRAKKYEYFVLTRNPELDLETNEPMPAITGKYLRSASTNMQEGRPAVSFTFTPQGGELFGKLTGKNLPSGGGTEETKIKRHLAIVLDGLIMSAPTINSKITTHGQITGDFTRKEVDNLVNILRSGALPATLKPQPVSESHIGALLGEDTVRAGVTAVGWAFAGVLVFMIVYYRFAGIVACLALFANLVLTVGFMVAVSATFTLPGLAGLVLMLGMAVDANVLIYERLREERDRGASLALAIRNGYERAFPTIIDTHLSSIFTAIVLYTVGNDQLKGFAISLTVGLIISLFTSLYMTRVLFDFWQTKGWLRKLGMFRLLSKPNINFMGIRNVVFPISMCVALLGLALFLYRTPDDLNIDFKGGTAFSGRLKEGESMDIKELREILSDKQQEKMLVVEKVIPLDKENREFEIYYKEPNGELSRPYEVVLANRIEGNSKAEVKKNLTERASSLPDWSVEQIFVSEFMVAEPDPNKSRFFTVRTSEMERPLVQVMLERLFRREENNKMVSLLKEIELTNIDTALLKSKGKVRLKFSDVASPSFVETLLHRQLRRQFKLDPATGKLKVEAEVQGIGTSKEGRFNAMEVTFDFPPERANKEYLQKVKTALSDAQRAFQRPQPERLENFDSQLAEDTRVRAMVAIFASWLAVILYLWFRFGSWTFGLAAVICLVHDLCFTLGAVAVSAYIPTFLGQALLIDDFKLDLTGVAALLTLVGYSVADTIVVFDRIREVRGKNPDLTPKIINDSVNQCLSRTLLTSGTTFVVVGVLYWFGGPGIHMFAYIMVIGVIIGTLSSIFIASPMLLFLGEGQQEQVRQRRREAAASPAKIATET